MAPGPSGSAPHGPAPSDYALLLVLGVIWGSTYMFIELALRSVPPLTIASARVVISLMVLGGLGLMLGHAVSRDRKSWTIYGTIGLVGTALPFSMMTVGQQYIDSSMAAILITIMPLFTLALAHVFTDDKASPRKLMGVVLGFLGILLLLGPAALEREAGTLVGQILYVGVALGYAIQQVMARRLGPAAGSHVMRAATTLFCGAVWLVPVTVVVERPWAVEPRLESALGVLAVGVLSTGVAHYLLFRLNARAGPNFVSANNYIAPPVGIFWGAVLLGEPVTWLLIAAVIVIFCGIALAVTKTKVVRK